MENEEDLFDITFDLAFLSNAVTAQMQINGIINDTDRMEVVYIELEGEEEETVVNVIAKKIEGSVN